MILTLLLATVTIRPGYIHAEPPEEQGPYQLEPFQPLHLYHGGKLVVSLLMAGTAATSPEASGNERLLVGGSSLLLGLPAAAVLYHSRRGHMTLTRRWQFAAFTVDLVLAGSLAAYVGYLIAEGGVGDQWTGLAAVSTGVLGLMVSRLDLIPLLND